MDLNFAHLIFGWNQKFALQGTHTKHVSKLYNTYSPHQKSPRVPKSFCSLKKRFKTTCPLRVNHTLCPHLGLVECFVSAGINLDAFPEPLLLHHQHPRRSGRDELGVYLIGHHQVGHIGVIQSYTHRTCACVCVCCMSVYMYIQYMYVCMSMHTWVFVCVHMCIQCTCVRVCVSASFMYIRIILNKATDTCPLMQAMQLPVGWYSPLSVPISLICWASSSENPCRAIWHPMNGSCLYSIWCVCVCVRVCVCVCACVHVVYVCVCVCVCELVLF